jgi:hypothetical protein
LTQPDRAIRIAFHHPAAETPAAREHKRRNSLATKRRDALKYGFGLVGAAIGLGSAGKVLAAAQKSEGETPAAATGGAGTQLVLHGVRWRISSQDLRRGELPPSGMRMIGRGELLDQPLGANGRNIGHFFSTYYQLNAPGKVAAHEPGSLELHTFVLPEGTIFGSGVASASCGSDGQFAVIGGTGRYLGARGSYVAHQSYADFGGGGTASFVFTLL